MRCVFISVVLVLWRYVDDVFDVFKSVIRIISMGIYLVKFLNI